MLSSIAILFCISFYSYYVSQVFVLNVYAILIALILHLPILVPKQISRFQVEDNMVKVRNAATEQDLGIQYKALKPEVEKLNIMAAKRQQVRCSWHGREIRSGCEGRGVL